MLVSNIKLLEDTLTPMLMTEHFSKILLSSLSNWELGASIPGRSRSTRAGAFFPPRLLLHPTPQAYPALKCLQEGVGAPQPVIAVQVWRRMLQNVFWLRNSFPEMCEMNRGSTNLLCWEVALTVPLEWGQASVWFISFSELSAYFLWLENYPAADSLSDHY